MKRVLNVNLFMFRNILPTLREVMSAIMDNYCIKTLNTNKFNYILDRVLIYIY